MFVVTSDITTSLQCTSYSKSSVYQDTKILRALEFTQHPIQWVPGALLPSVKRPGREADHSPPASAELKKMWIYISAPPYAFMT
jgi:hypothetical protein